MIELWLIVMAVASVGAFTAMTMDRPVLAASMLGCISAAWGALALLQVWRGNYPVAAWDAVSCGVWAYIAWRNRPRGNRLAEKATGVVRNLGHRLAVIAVPTGGKS